MIELATILQITPESAECIEHILRSEHRLVRVAEIIKLCPYLADNPDFFLHPERMLQLQPDPILGFIMQWMPYD